MLDSAPPLESTGPLPLGSAPELELLGGKELVRVEVLVVAVVGVVPTDDGAPLVAVETVADELVLELEATVGCVPELASVVVGATVVTLLLGPPTLPLLSASLQLVAALARMQANTAPNDTCSRLMPMELLGCCGVFQPRRAVVVAPTKRVIETTLPKLLRSKM